jgi:UDP-galactopyranose mutase
MYPQLPLVVFSHLRWNFVYQRPQHIISRLARVRRVLFIEEPLYTEGKPYWDLSAAEEGVLVCRPHTSIESGGFSSAQVSLLTEMTADLLEQQEIFSFTAWLYTPMAYPIAKALSPSVLIYDCMDELSAFNGAPAALRDLEARLLKDADLVFTGGPSLYRAKVGKHPNVHCFPSSVDVDHFRSALEGGDPGDQAAIPHPRLGYYGVIDERMDLDLVDAIAGSHPEWQLVMIGPVAKINPATLPRRNNIHWLGQKTYDELPVYLSGWDLALLPFALNEATRYISPTKTLEYMAAERQIVSTPITDVVEPYGHIVYIGQDQKSFIERCEQALASTEQERQARIADMRAVLSKTSWDNTAASMEALIEQAEKNDAGQLFTVSDDAPSAVAPAS